MDFANAFPIPAPRQRVWDALFDPEIVRQVLPGCRRLEKTGPSEYEMTLAAGIGVLRGVFSGTVVFSDLVEPSSSAMTITARGSLGRVAGEGALSLEDQGDSTVLGYTATFTFGGPMAGLGESLMRNVADALVRDAMHRFNTLVVAGPGDHP